MLIVASVLAVIGLAALVTAVVTSNELLAWVCIGASALGVLLLVFDAIRERTSRRAVVPAAGVAGGVGGGVVGATTEVIEAVETTEVIEPVIAPEPAAEVESAEVESEEVESEEVESSEFLDAPEEYDDTAGVEDYPDEVVYDEPDYDTVSDDEPEYPEPAEVAAVHTVSEDYVAADVDDDYDEVVEQSYDEAVDQPHDEAVGDDRMADTVADVSDEPEVQAAETVTYTYVESDDTATTYTYVESDDTATTYTYVESDDTGSTLAHDEPWNTLDRSDTTDGN
jgi:hypothetical protein